MVQQENSSSGTGVLTPDEFVQVRDGAQLSRLSSVLNGLEGGAQMMQRNLQEAGQAVKAGTYCVDPIQLSKRIVGEALRIV